KPVLQESEKKFRQVIEASPVPMVISDRNGNTEFVNRKFVDLFGYTLKELPTVEDWWPLAYPDEEYRREVRESWESAVKKAMREKTEMEPLETKVTCKDGSVRHVLFRFSAVDDRNLVVLDDITERKRGEEEMREMSEAAMQLVDFPPERDMYDFICEKVKQFVDEGIVAVNSIDLENDTLQVRKVLGIGEAKLKMIDKLLGRKTTSISLSGIFQEAKEALTSGKLAKVEGGLYTVFFQKFPKTVCQQIEKVVGIKGIYSIGLRRKGKLLGSVTILASKNSRVNKNVIETFVNQASIALERKQAEEALENAAAGWRTTFDSARDLIMVLDPHFRITRANLATAKFLGRSVNELPGKTCYQLVHGTDAPPDWCPLEKMRQTKKREEAEFYLPEKDVWLSVSADPIVDEQGNLIGVVHIVRDVTERKRAEEQIKLKSQFLESLIEQSPLPTFVIDSNGICVMVNRAFLKAYNVPQKELVLGKNALTEPANVRQGVVKYIKEALSGKIVETPETEFISPYEDKRMVTKSKLFPIFDATSKLTNVVVLHEDITERKRAEEAVEKERQRLFSVLDVMPAFVYLQAPDYSIPYVNRRFREMFGDPGDQPCYEVFHGRKEPCDPCITLRVLETRAPQTWEWTSKDGRTYMIYEDLFPGTEGEDLVLEIGVDITQRKRAEEALRLQSEIVANMSEGVYLVRASDGVIAYANPKFEELFGYGPGEMVGRHVSIVNAPSDESPE
ncbi:MAG: PAS domain S-box protein, partial [Desulfobacteraceae bacterium]|nr:PAS domain S-box protein [Desulfobacteraceae bacterium]